MIEKPLISELPSFQIDNQILYISLLLTHSFKGKGLRKHGCNLISHRRPKSMKLQDRQYVKEKRITTLIAFEDEKRREHIEEQPTLKENCRTSTTNNKSRIKAFQDLHAMIFLTLIQ